MDNLSYSGDDPDLSHDESIGENALLEKVKFYARQVEALLLENQSLRAKLMNLGKLNVGDADEEEEILPRKVARKSINCSVNSVVESSELDEDMNYANVNCSKGTKVVKVKEVIGNRVMKKDDMKKKIFQVIDSKVLEVRDLIVEAGCSDFNIKQTSVKAPIKISVCQQEANKIRDVLKSSKSSFHEFKLASEKSSCFLIKGLVGVQDADLGEIKKQLLEFGLPQNLILSMYTTGAMRKSASNNVNTIVKLVLPPLTDVGALAKIKYLNYVGVRFEAFKSKKVIQCWNCQRFGHAASGCQHPHRCVKCGENHLKEACPRSINKKLKLVCCNCGGDHTANNLLNCQFYINHFSKESVKKNSDNVSSVSFRQASVLNNVKLRPSLRKSGLSFSSVVGRPKVPGDVVRASGEPKNNLMIEVSEKIDKMYEIILIHEKILRKLSSYNA